MFYPEIKKSRPPNLSKLKYLFPNYVKSANYFSRNPNILLNSLNHSHQQVLVMILGPVSSATVLVDGISYRVMKCLTWKSVSENFCGPDNSKK